MTFSRPLFWQAFGANAAALVSATGLLAMLALTLLLLRSRTAPCTAAMCVRHPIADGE
jgi:hypothetical protein